MRKHDRAAWAPPSCACPAGQIPGRATGRSNYHRRLPCLTALRAGARAWFGPSALLLGIALAPASAAGVLAVAVSPLNGTPDASPYTQISFLGVPSNDTSGAAAVGRSG